MTSIMNTNFRCIMLFPPFYFDFVVVLGRGGIINYEPKTYSDAMGCKDSSRWKLAMEEEMHSLMKNNTWELVSKPEKQRIVDCKWIFKIKEGNSPGDKVRYKARLVAKVFTQREGIDYKKFSHRL
ncbi:hypothetical protein UlMin_007924 [Ulmus minor]